MSIDVCPGCDLRNNLSNLAHDDSLPCEETNNQLILYTFSLHDTDFIHQLAVDAYSSQHVNCEPSHTMRAAFGLIGLYLRFEQGYSGRQVQQAHRLLAEQTKIWPTLNQKNAITSMTVQDALQATPGDERNDVIIRWGTAAWSAWADAYATIATLCEQYRFLVVKLT